MSSRCKALPRPPNDSESSADSGKAAETSPALFYTTLPVFEQENSEKKLGIPQTQVAQRVLASEYGKEMLVQEACACYILCQTRYPAFAAP